MSKINHVTMFKGKNKVEYKVFYENWIRTYNEKDNLPNTVVEFILNSANAETHTTEYGTVTRFK